MPAPTVPGHPSLRNRGDRDDTHAGTEGKPPSATRTVGRLSPTRMAPPDRPLRPRRTRPPPVPAASFLQWLKVEDIPSLVEDRRRLHREERQPFACRADPVEDPLADDHPHPGV